MIYLPVLRCRVNKDLRSKFKLDVFVVKSKGNLKNGIFTFCSIKTCEA